jgi:SAM-dependent methyltransferase
MMSVRIPQSKKAGGPMPTPSRRDHWDGVYGAKAEDEVSWFEASPEISLRLIERTGIAKSAPILDVGGGLSRLASRLVAAGYSDVTVMDISAEAIRRLLQRPAPDSAVQTILADVTAWQPGRAYEIWHDRAVLHFLIDERDREAYRSALDAALAPQGQALIATFAPSGPEKCSGLPVRRYGAADLEALFGDGFALLETFEFDHQTPTGRVQRFHVGRLQRR